MDPHRDAFLAEADDGITALNNALLALESDPTDAAAMDDVFRVAHTLKGNAAAMGYDDVSSLGHALEDLLDAVRAGERAVTPELMDLLFEGVDAVEALLGEIRDEGAVTTDPTPIAARLRRARSTDDEATADVSGDEATADPPDDEETTDAPGDEATVDVSGDTLASTDLVDGDADGLASAGLDEPACLTVRTATSSMPGVDASLVLRALADASDAYATDPAPSALEDGEYDDGFDVFVADADASRIAAELETLPQVAAVDDAGVPEDPSVSGEPTTPSDGPSVDAAGGSESEDDAPAETPAAPDPDEITSIRVGVDQVDELYGLVEQLVTSRIKLHRELEAVDADAEALAELDKLAASLQDTAMNMRLIPFSQVADAFPRLVRDVARDLDKRVSFELQGADVELDRTILTEMRDPLVHVLRNAVDHGIEPPDARAAAGKDRTGSIRLTADRERDHVVIEVADDGGGLDADHLRTTAVDEGIVSAETAASMPDEEAYDLVFHPGLSTADAVTDVSGRGVGMDVVRTTVRDLDGSVSVESQPGAGTTIRFRLPVTVAIVTVMFVDVAGTEYGIPIKSIAEVSAADGVETVHGDEVVRHDDDLYPVVRLAERLETADGRVESAGRPLHTATAPAAPDGGVDDEREHDSSGEVDAVHTDGMLVRIRSDTRRVALHCDAVLDQEEVVVKPLDGPLSGTAGLGGTAVLGDGNVVGILDVVSL